MLRSAGAGERVGVGDAMVILFGGADFVYNTAMSVWRYLPFSGGSGVSSSSSRGNMKGGEHHEDNKRHLLDPTSPTHHDPSKTNFVSQLVLAKHCMP